MSRPAAVLADRRSTLATVLWVAGLTGAAVIALGWIEVYLQIPDEDMTGPLFVILVTLMILYGTLGRLLVARRPDEAVGWIFLVTPLFLGLTFGNFSILGWAEVGEHLELRSMALLGWFAPFALPVAGAAFTPALLIAFPLLALVFPDGHLPGPRWRWPVRALLTAMTATVVLMLFGESPPDQDLPSNPLAIPGIGGTIGMLAYALEFPTLVAGALLGVLSIVVRVRQGTPVVRRQLAWLLAATVVVAVLLLITFSGGKETSVTDLIGIASLSLIPLATTIAVLRYRLYEIDRIVSRSIAYALVTAILVTVFAGAVLASQAVLADVTGGDTIPVALSTLLVFALFQPLRRRVQRIVDRRFNRRRVDAQRAIDAFGHRLRDEVDLATVRDGTLATAGALVEPRSAGLWVRGGGPA